MLAQSPRLPLAIDYVDAYSDIGQISEKDVRGITLALKQRRRVRSVRLRMSDTNMQKFVVAMDKEYPVLENLILEPPTFRGATLILSETLQAPRLRHLALSCFTLPTECRLLTTAVDLVTLALAMGHPGTYFQPHTLLQWLSFMPRLEKLLIVLLFPVSDRDVDMQLIHASIMTHITLPDLRWFEFRGASAYMEGVVCRLTAPRLEKLHIWFFKQLSFSVPCLLQFMNTASNFRFDSAKFEFSGNQVHVGVYLREEAEVYVLSMKVYCGPLDLQVSSMAQIFDSLSQMFSTVEHLALERKGSSEEHNGVDRTEWRKLLRSFSKVKTLRIDDGLVREFSRSLRLDVVVDDGEFPPRLELLPELQELTYSGSGDTGDAFAFTSFINARQNAGRPVTLVSA
jgi:hypothetical protein